MLLSKMNPISEILELIEVESLSLEAPPAANLYYGAADSSIALAQGSSRALLSWLDANGHSEHSNDRRHA